jgi:uncharacterized protein (TIGR03437 family)
MSRFWYLKTLLAVLAPVICTGTLQAATINESTNTIALACDLVAGPGTAKTVGLTLSAAVTGGVSVTASVPAGAPVAIATATQTVTSTTTATNFSFNVAAGCAGVTTSPQTVTISFAATGYTIPSVTATITITNWIVASPTPSIALTCDTVQGPGSPVPVNIKLAGGSSPVSVTVTAPSLPGVLPATATQTVSSSTAATPFNFQAPAICAGITTSPMTVPLVFTAGGASGPSVSVNAIITLTGSLVTVSPSSVSLSCNKGGGVVPGSISVTSAVAGGQHYYVSSTSWPSWLTALTGPGSSSSATATATATPTTITLTPTTCATATAGTFGYNLHVVNTPGQDQIVAVTITIGATNPLTASPSPVPLTYTKAVGEIPAIPGSHAVVLTNGNSPASVYYTMNTATLPAWLNVDTPSASFSTSTKTINFNATSAGAALALGTYTANVHFAVSGDVDLVVPVTLLVENPSSTLSLVEGTTGKTINWTIGQPIPTVTVTPISTDQPIEFNAVGNGVVSSVTPSYGIAYSFGTPLTATLNQSAITGSAPGTQQTGNIVVSPAGCTQSSCQLTYPVTVNILSPGAQITSVFPTALPVATSGSFNVTLTGSGFVKSSDPTQQTKVGVVNGGYIILDSNIAVTVVNSTTITMVIGVQQGDPLLPFGSANTIELGVCNPGGTSCTTPTTNNGTIVGEIGLSIGSVPIIQAVTSAASFIQATPPALPTVAPYDILSIFGTNFCMLAASGCTSQNPTIYGQINSTTMQYENSLTPDGTNYLSVKFQTHASPPVLIGAAAPILFATNGQINVLVPSQVNAKAGQVVDVVVTFGPPSTNNVSAPYSVMIGATDPGVFTVGGDGVGSAAALDKNYNLITDSNPAGFGASATSDTVTLYVTGLGVPDTDGLASSGWDTLTEKCITTTAYYNQIVATGVDPGSDDGLVMQSAVYNTALGYNLPPCFKSTDNPASTNLPTVTIGNVAGTVTYAGWTPDSVAGLYQIDVTLPSGTAISGGNPSFLDVNGIAVAYSNLVTGVHLPVVIKSYGSYSQQSGVYVAVQGRLVVTAPSVLIGASGSSWPSSNTSFSATGGAPSPTYQFTVDTSSAPMPAGLTLNSDGSVSGSPTAAAGSYPVTVDVSDSVSGFSGKLSVTFVITGS